VISKVCSKKAAACSGNYQDNISIPLACEHDDDTIANDELDGGEITDSVLSGDNPNTTQPLEYTKDKYNAKIIK
jgi:hypothetical protein